jgi:DNA polymerase theta
MSRRIGLSKRKSQAIASKASQERIVKARIETEDVRSPSHPQFALPAIMVTALERLGIQQFHEWQKECLLLPRMLHSPQNLLYSAPTSGGKTLVAEILMVKRLIEERKRAIVVLPFISIVTEFTHKLKRCYPDFLIAGYFGSQNGPAFQDVDIAVCTIEKANNLINRLIEENQLETVGTVVIDELHLIGNDGRGHLLEWVITKLRLSPVDIKLIGMSATLPNIETLAEWLDATLYITDFRPVPLVEYIKVGNTLYSKLGSPTRTLEIDPKDAKKLGDPDMLVPIVHEVIQQGSSVLIFCAKKIDCENCARNISKLMVVEYDPDYQHKLTVARKSLIQELNQSPAGLDPVLAQCLPHGLAYHHSGLTVEERSLLETAFRNGVISVLCATSTLASGVNLPARRVIFRSPYVGRRFLDMLDYKQMRGRAGRFGLDTFGESIVMCSESEFPKCLDLLRSKPRNLESSLAFSEMGMSRGILEAVVNKMAETKDDVVRYLEHTLLFHQATDEGLKGKESCEESLRYLIGNEFLQFEERSGLLIPTKLGVACFASSLDPIEAVFLYKELVRAQKHFVLVDELHVIYQITPALLRPTLIDWRKLFDVFLRLKQEHKVVADAVGIHEGYLFQLAQGAVPKDVDRLNIHIRFFHALLLYDMIHEHSFQALVTKYGMDRGSIQNIQNLASTYAGMVKIFCNRLQYHLIETLIGSVQDRIVFGVEADLLSLTRIAGVDRRKARFLHDKGFKSPKDISQSDISDLFACFREAFADSPDSLLFKLVRELYQSAKDLVHQI